MTARIAPTTPMPPASPAAALHHQLVARLQQAGYLPSPRLVAAFQAVPRHLFVPDVPLEVAYQDRAIATKRCDGIPISSCSQPTIVALMLAQLQVQPGQRVLEIGAGTGYNAALLAELVGPSGQVIALDCDADLVNDTRDRLQHLGYTRIEVLQADGCYGYADAAPYDRIILSVAAGDLAPAWHQQLRPDGRLVLPLALAGSAQVSFALQPCGSGWHSCSAIPCSFMPLRGAAIAPPPTRILALAPGLTLGIASAALPVEQVLALLATTPRHYPSGLHASLAELDSSLRLWLALRDRRFGELATERSTHSIAAQLPSLQQWVGLSGGRAWGLFAPRAIAALLGAPRPPRVQSHPSYELTVGLYGDEPALADDLLALLRAWDAAGRPGASALRVRAEPQPSDRPPQPGETILDKPWTRLFLNSAGGDRS